jgi:hypothetical protein
MADFRKLGKGAIGALGKLNEIANAKRMTGDQAAADAISKAAESAGMNAPVTANRSLTTMQDFHTSFGDSVRKRAMDMQATMDSLDYKYDKGHRVFTEDSARKNWPPMTVLGRVLEGNRIMREDPTDFLSKKIIDPETGKAMRTPHEAGYKVRLEHAPDNWSEFVIPESAIKGSVSEARGGFIRRAVGGGVHMVDGGKMAKGMVSALSKLNEIAKARQAEKDLRVYHGSPHRMAPTPDNPLGKFDSSKLGTGEGGAAYGVGHYLAQAKDVAKTYRPRSPQHEEKLIKEYNKAQSKRDYPKMEVLEDAMLHKAPDEILAKYSNIEDGYTPEHAKAASDYAQWFEKNKPEVGGLYHIDLPKEHIANMLDWDKPLSQQDVLRTLNPRVVNDSTMFDNAYSMEAVVPIGNGNKRVAPITRTFSSEEEAKAALDNMTGAELYNLLSQTSMPSGASDFLRQAGIPGLKYYDEGSRHLNNWEVGKSGSGTWVLKNHELSPNQWKEFPTEEEAKAAYNAMPDTGTRNFVVFPGNEDIAKIVDREKKGGVIHMAKAGKVGTVAEGITGALTKLNEIAKARKAATEVAEVDPAVQAVVMAADRAAAGRKAADVAKAISPMKMSEALGNMNLEGKGKLKITQADRTRVGGGNIGGPMFSGLQQVDPIYDQAAWGVGKKSTASAMINDSDPNTLWSTVLGSADQLKSNPIVFNKLRKGFTDSMKAGNLSPELEAKINHNLALTFGEGADIRDPKIWNMANTYEKRGALADLMLGQGIAPGKGGVALGGEKSGKGVIFQPSEILKRETEPMLLHPEHGGDVPTFAVGPRLFNLSGETMTRPDLHPGYPVILKGEDMGVVFEPVAGKEAMPEFVKQYKNVKGREPTGYFDWTKGLVGEGAPTQPITEEYLTYLQKLGKKDGGAMQKPSWHVAVEKHMKDGGYTMVDTKHIPKIRSLKQLAKGGEAKEESASLKELYDALPDFYDQAIKPEVESYKKPRAFTDLMNRGVIANNPVSAVVDLTNFGLSGVDALTKGTRFPTRLSSEKPFGGSEQIKDLMKEYGMTTDEERPIAETLLGFMSPGSLVGGTIKGANTIKKAGSTMLATPKKVIVERYTTEPKKARGGLTLMR